MKMFEALIINDGSKDRTSQIGHGYEERYPETFRVIDKSNGHYGSCVNRGLIESAGAFIKILDADDSFDNRIFTSYLDYFKVSSNNEDIDFILSDFVQVDDNQSLLSKHPYSTYKNAFCLDSLLEYDIVRWFIHGLTYRSTLLKGIDYKQKEGVAYTDLEWSFYPAAFARMGLKFNGFLYKYTKQREGQSVDPAVQGKNIEMQIGIIEDMIKRSSSLMGSNMIRNRHFISDLLKLNVSHIYQLVLLTLNRYIVSDSLLHSFDECLLKESPELYTQVGDYQTSIGGCRFRPINLYRQNKHIRLRAVQYLYNLADIKTKLLGR